jgi:hypothetical protein
LHWFVSQSIFVVQIHIYGKDGQPKQYNPDIEYLDLRQFNNCGYSPIAIIFSIAAAVVLLLSVAGLGFRRFPEGAPPVVSSCSAAISAVCHPGERSVEMRYKELKWGVDGTVMGGGHCALVEKEAWEMGRAWEPVEGVLYAGVKEE